MIINKVGEIMFEVIIVEDEDLIRKGLAYTFNWLSYDCVVIDEACNGKEGLEKIDKKKPDIVITDIKMPLLDGLGMLKSFDKRQFETVIITGYAEFEYAKQAIDLDVSDFILKPIDHDELGKVIEKLIVKIKKKQMVKVISENVKDFSDIVLLDEKLYFKNSTYKSRLIPKVLKYIETYYSEKASIEIIAGQLEVSTTYLSRKFKEDTKHTFNDFLNKYRLQKALEFMYKDEMKIYEIAEKVGFSEYKYFSRVFKSYFDHSPSEFMQVKLYKGK